MKITSLREARKFVEIDCADDLSDMTVRCRGCGEKAHFADGTVEALFDFAARHSVCSEIGELITNETEGA